MWTPINDETLEKLAAKYMNAEEELQNGMKRGGCVLLLKTSEGLVAPHRLRTRGRKSIKPIPFAHAVGLRNTEPYCDLKAILQNGFDIRHSDHFYDYANATLLDIDPQEQPYRFHSQASKIPLLRGDHYMIHIWAIAEGHPLYDSPGIYGLKDGELWSIRAAPSEQISPVIFLSGDCPIEERHARKEHYRRDLNRRDIFFRRSEN